MEKSSNIMDLDQGSRHEISNYLILQHIVDRKQSTFVRSQQGYNIASMEEQSTSSA